MSKISLENSSQNIGRRATLENSNFSKTQNKPFFKEKIYKEPIDDPDYPKFQSLKKILTPSKSSKSFSFIILGPTGFILVQAPNGKVSSHEKWKDSSLNSSGQMGQSFYKTRNQSKILKPTLPKIVDWQSRTARNGFCSERNEIESMFISPTKRQ